MEEADDEEEADEAEEFLEVVNWVCSVWRSCTMHERNKLLTDT